MHILRKSNVTNEFQWPLGLDVEAPAVKVAVASRSAPNWREAVMFIDCACTLPGLISQKLWKELGAPSVVGHTRVIGISGQPVDLWVARIHLQVGRHTIADLPVAVHPDSTWTYDLLGNGVLVRLKTLLDQGTAKLVWTPTGGIRLTKDDV